MAGSLKPSFGAIVQQARDNVLKDFPTERLKYVQEGDFAQALRLLELLLSGDPDMPTYKDDVLEAEAFLARLCPEPEDSP